VFYFALTFDPNGISSLSFLSYSLPSMPSLRCIAFCLRELEIVSALHILIAKPKRKILLCRPGDGAKSSIRMDHRDRGVSV
jgi:hypothetical protein